MKYPTPKAASELLSFINSAPTPFHAVSSASRLLKESGFIEITERDSWNSICKPGGKYFLTRNASSLVAFALGSQYKPGNGVSMLGAHTDSPCLRVKPISNIVKDGYIQVGVETYGGGLWHTWFDRDLSLAGRVISKSSKGQVITSLVKIDRPILRIPTLAIHLDRQESFTFNKETHLCPIAGLVAAELNRSVKDHADAFASTASDASKSGADDPSDRKKRHNTHLLEILSKEIDVNASDIMDFELLLYDTQDACIGGLHEEFLLSPRLDNLCMSFCSIKGLIRSSSRPEDLDNETACRLVALFDHEEIGSCTAQGADSNFLPSILRRLSVLDTSPSDGTAYEQSLAKSFLISADMAHAIHPNYREKYESNHGPKMNQGPVIKVNANARYATNSLGTALLQLIAEKVHVPLQYFVVKNDSPCGSTIGPMLSAALGTRTLDLGNPQLSMHSIRETGGVHDVEHAIKLFDGFFRHYSVLAEEFM